MSSPPGQSQSDSDFLIVEQVKDIGADEGIHATFKARVPQEFYAVFGAHDSCLTSYRWMW